jgi:hypothetical protein
MKFEKARSTCAVAVIGALAAATPSVSQAEGDWEFAATIYGWLPTIGGSFHVPIAGNVEAEMDPSDVLDALNFTFMGLAEVRKDRWGALTDVIYLDLSNTEKHSRDLTIGEQQLPAGIDAKIDVGLSGWVWTLGGTYLAVDEPSHAVTIVAGTRLLDLSTDLKFTLSGDVAGVPLPGRTGKGEADLSNWDAIVGVKGQFDLGESGGWFVPYYADLGTGQSDFTWQAILGLGYAFDWGDVLAAWRYLDYDFGSGDNVEDLWQSGAAVGVRFHF